MKFLKFLIMLQGATPTIETFIIMLCSLRLSLFSLHMNKFDFMIGIKERTIYLWMFDIDISRFHFHSARGQYCLQDWVSNVWSCSLLYAKTSNCAWPGNVDKRHVLMSCAFTNQP